MLRNPAAPAAAAPSWSSIRGSRGESPTDDRPQRERERERESEGDIDKGRRRRRSAGSDAARAAAMRAGSSILAESQTASGDAKWISRARSSRFSLLSSRESATD